MRRLKGLTLIEVILYLSLFTLFIITVIQFFINTYSINQSTTAKISIQNNGMFISNHLETKVDISYELIEGSSTLGVNSSYVYLERPSDGDVMIYRHQNDVLYYGDGVSEYPLNYTSVDVSQFFVEKIIDNDGLIQGMRVTFTVVDEDNPNISETFETSYLL